VAKRAIIPKGRDVRFALVDVALVAVAIGWRSVLLGALTMCAQARAAEADARPKPVCLNASETREEVKSRKLLEPFTALKMAATQRRARGTWRTYARKSADADDDCLCVAVVIHKYVLGPHFAGGYRIGGARFAGGYGSRAGYGYRDGWRL
jgi:hypothetical protein